MSEPMTKSPGTRRPRDTARAFTRAASASFVLGSTLVAACAHPSQSAPARAAPLAPITARDAARLPPVIVAAERAARERLRPFSLEPQRPVLIQVARSRAQFEEETGQTDPLLRAWTEIDVVTFAPLETWSDRSPRAVAARVAHELCHAAIAQRFGSRERVRAAHLPRFFEEGACSVAADQAELRLPLQEVRARATEDVLSADAFRRDPALSYAAAHHLMAAVRAAHGDDVFASIVDAAAEDGAPGCVERALEARLGRSLGDALEALRLREAPGAS
jgi:hypothetical protein